MLRACFKPLRMPTMSHMTQEFSDRWHMEDWHSFGKSYVMTLRCWLDRVKDWQGLDELDPRFRRMRLGGNSFESLR